MLRKLSWLLLIFSFIGFHTYSDSSYHLRNAYYDFNNKQIRDSVISTNKPLAIVGDLQRTSIWELLIGREQNDFERSEIIKKISDENPSAVITLGDMVFDGAEDNNWQSFDILISPIMNKKIPIIPAIGNHEYWGSDLRALNNIDARFLRFEKLTYYTQRYGKTALVFLNSNKSDLGSDGWHNEKLWFKNILNYYDSNPNVKGVIVFLHHPPFSNSLLTGNDEDIIKDFVPEFVNSKKTLAMISGHAHTYERFNIQNKTFIISGGGGGPRVKLKSGKDCYKDFCTLPSPRPFNFLLLNEDKNGVKITAEGLNKSSSSFFTLDKVSLPFN